MPLTVNGQMMPVPDPPTLEKLLLTLHPRKPYAVARNEEFISGAAYRQCKLTDGDRVEIVHPSAGG
jgi:sulfur carrier protein